jgi:6,7-dimethyl-8-ribityllumazine synthase
MLLEGRRRDRGRATAMESITVPARWNCPGQSRWRRSGKYRRLRRAGVVIRGETWHFEIVAGKAPRGLIALTMDGLAVGNGSCRRE